MALEALSGSGSRKMSKATLHFAVADAMLSSMPVCFDGLFPAVKAHTAARRSSEISSKDIGSWSSAKVTCGNECTLSGFTGQYQVASNPAEVEELPLMTYQQQEERILSVRILPRVQLELPCANARAAGRSTAARSVQIVGPEGNGPSRLGTKQDFRPTDRHWKPLPSAFQASELTGSICQ